MKIVTGYLCYRDNTGGQEEWFISMKGVYLHLFSIH